MHHRVSHCRGQTVDGTLGKLLLFRIDSVPDDIKDTFTFDFIKYSIAAEHDEIVEVWFNSELGDLWLGYDDSFSAPVLREFGCYVTKSPRYRQASWIHSMRP